MHRIVVNRANAMVSLVADGFFGDEALTAAAADLHRAITSLGDRAGQHVTLYDMSGLKVVPPAVLERFARYFTDANMAPLWACRVALVTQSPMVTLQMERVRRVRDTVRLFSDRREAIAWLLADRARSAA